MNLFLTFTLCVWGVSLSLGYSLSKLETRNATDTYEIVEGEKSPFKIVMPSAENLTLREIVFYHIIEKPYYSNPQQIQESRAPEIDMRSKPRESKSLDMAVDFDETRRPFTNGHGYQYLDTTEPSATDAGKPEQPIEEADKNPDDDEYEEYYVYYDENNEPIYELSKPKSSSADATDTIAAQAELTEETATIPAAAPETTDAVTTTTDAVTVPNKAVPETTPATLEEVTGEATTPVDDVVEEKKLARNQLFDQLKERYHKLNKPRSKREANPAKIPEAPILPALDIDELRQTLRKLSPKKDVQHLVSRNKSRSHQRNHKKWLSTTPNHFSPPAPTQLSDEMDIYDDDEIKQIIQDKLSEVFGNVTPSSERIEEPKTYGMNLTLDKGYVWNDFWSNPPIMYDVGSPESDSVENTKDEIKEDIPRTKSVDASATESDSIDNKVIEEHIPRTKSSNVPVTESPVTMDDRVIEELHNILVDLQQHKEEEIKAIKTLALADPENHARVDKFHEIAENEHIVDEIPNGDEPEVHKFHENQENEYIVDEVNDDEPEVHKFHEIQENEPVDEETPNGDEPKIQGRQIDSLVEIMKDERFWKWLAEWTATYMDNLSKYIRKIVREEIEKNEEKHAKSDNQTKQPESNVTESQNHTEEPVTENNKEEITEFDGKSTYPLTHSSNSNYTYQNNQEIDDVSEFVKKHNDRIYSNSNPHMEEDNTNKNEELYEASNEDNEEQSSAKTENNKYIFGNTVDSEKVTNIFIFYPDKDIDSAVSNTRDGIKDYVDKNKIRTKTSTSSVEKENKPIALRSTRDELNAVTENDKTDSSDQKNESTETTSAPLRDENNMTIEDNTTSRGTEAKQDGTTESSTTSKPIDTEAKKDETTESSTTSKPVETESKQDETTESSTTSKPVGDEPDKKTQEDKESTTPSEKLDNDVTTKPDEAEKAEEKDKEVKEAAADKEPKKDESNTSDR